MSDELLPFYNRELSYIRRLAAQFAQANPKIAGRLRLGAESSQDPHVERLIEAFAYLNARTRHKLEDDFPEITEAILGVLYPHYQAPIPAMAILQFELDEGQNELVTGHTIARHTQLETEPIQGEPCRFRTCYPTTLWPIELQLATLSGPPFQAPVVPMTEKATAVLRLVLRCRSEKVRFADLALDSLRFFLKGQAQHVYPLYALLLNNTLGLAVGRGPSDPAPVLLDASCVRPVGFERDQGMLPYTARSFMGYRLLTEFFAFAPKFLFLDVTGLGQDRLQQQGNQIELYFYLDRTIEEVEQNISADTFRLGCTPIVNLYPKRAEPIELSQHDYEYRVIPDARRPLTHEIYAIERVIASSSEGEEFEFQPFFSVKHTEEGRAGQTFWHGSRRLAEATDEEGQIDHGTEVFLSLVDLGFHPSGESDWTVEVETTCLNRDLPHQLPFGGDQPRLQFSEGGALVSVIRCLTPPTRTLRPGMKRGALWRLISHLSLNHLSLVENSERADALREILKLYDFVDSDETRKMINGITQVTSRRVTGRVGHGGDAFCRGLEVTVQFDESHFTGSGLFLFASVLERFLALYCTVNSFTRMIATVKGRDGELRRWPPRAGEQVLV